MPVTKIFKKVAFDLSLTSTKRIYCGKVRLGSQLTLNPLQVKIDKSIVICQFLLLFMLMFFDKLV